jgi:tetratricopeptide (TPR) repeat protein
MIPMRRIWERTGSVRTERLVPRTASAGELEAVERDAAAEPNRRDLTKKLVALYALSGDVQRAQIAAERWSERDPLDPEALTARADLAARSGDRERAIRLLGSVLDVRPGDIKAQRRLARLHRWSGRSALACRYEIAAAEMRLTDAKALTAAVSCAREGGHGWLADALLGNADVAVRKRAASPATAAAEADLSGDVRVEAVWDDDVDLDLALLAPDGSRLSWLGAPTRAVISARDVVGGRGEQLAIRGAPAGEYVVEVVRAKGEGRVRGKVTVAIGSSRRTVPFELDGVRATIAIASVELRQRLVPVSDGWR